MNNSRRGTAVIEKCGPSSCDFSPKVSYQPLGSHGQLAGSVYSLSSLYWGHLSWQVEPIFATLLSLLREPGSSLLHVNVFTHWACPPQACRPPLELAWKQRKSTVNVSGEGGDERKMSEM